MSLVYLSPAESAALKAMRQAAKSHDEEHRRMVAAAQEVNAAEKAKTAAAEKAKTAAAEKAKVASRATKSLATATKPGPFDAQAIASNACVKAVKALAREVRDCGDAKRIQVIRSEMLRILTDHRKIAREVKSIGEAHPKAAKRHEEALCRLEMVYEWILRKILGVQDVMNFLGIPQQTIEDDHYDDDDEDTDEDDEDLY